MPPPIVVCYLCGREYGRASIEIHQKQCKEKWVKIEEKKPKHLRKPLPPEPLERSGAGLEAYNRAASEAFNTAVLVPCEFCGRTFLEEKLAIHNRSCTRENPARSVNSTLATSTTIKATSTTIKATSTTIKATPSTTKKSITSTRQSAPQIQECTALSGSYSSNKSVRPSADVEKRLERLEMMALALVKEIQAIRQAIS